MRPSYSRVALGRGGSVQVTELRAGESLLAAATRLASETAGHVVVALDLSADPPRFELVPRAEQVVLRPMTSADLTWLTRWRNEPGVAAWWDDDPSDLDGITEQYGPDLGEATPTRLWIAEQRGRSVGFVQDYPVADDPAYARLTGHPEALGVDYLVGEGHWAGRGFGTRMLWAWLLTVASRTPRPATCFAAPDHRNGASLRVLRKVGFVESAWFDEPTVRSGTITVVGHTLDVATVL
ncbi:MAG: GNAT family N-acetyltransferase [Nocardioides sp.]|uniref:GNAT family N-acetyltransferase n=1 Tax=Nocardioides sp. TaxID=35761 RepID=UPI003EFCBD6C